MIFITHISTIADILGITGFLMGVDLPDPLPLIILLTCVGIVGIHLLKKAKTNKVITKDTTITYNITNNNYYYSSHESKNEDKEPPT